MKENLPKDIMAFIKTLTVYFVNQQIHGVIHYSDSFLSRAVLDTEKEQCRNRNPVPHSWHLCCCGEMEVNDMSS